MPRLVQLRQTPAFRNCGNVASNGFSGICTASKGNPVSSIFRWIAGILVAGEADEAHFALLLRLVERFGGAVRGG